MTATIRASGGCASAKSPPTPISFETTFPSPIVDKLLIEEDTAQMYNVPGKAVMLNAYNNKTDIIFCFHSEAEIPYNYRDQEEQRSIILRALQRRRMENARTVGRIAARSENFYFDKMCQIRMPSWTRGRVAWSAMPPIALRPRPAWEGHWQSSEQPPWPTRSKASRRFRSRVSGVQRQLASIRRGRSGAGCQLWAGDVRPGIGGSYSKETLSSVLLERGLRGPDKRRCVKRMCAVCSFGTVGDFVGTLYQNDG